MFLSRLYVLVYWLSCIWLFPHVSCTGMGFTIVSCRTSTIEKREIQPYCAYAMLKQAIKYEKLFNFLSNYFYQCTDKLYTTRNLSPNIGIVPTRNKEALDRKHFVHANLREIQCCCVRYPASSHIPAVCKRK